MFRLEGFCGLLRQSCVLNVRFLLEQISQLRRAKGVLPGVTTRAKGRAGFAHLVWVVWLKSVYGAYNPGFTVYFHWSWKGG